MTPRQLREKVSQVVFHAVKAELPGLRENVQRAIARKVAAETAHLFEEVRQETVDARQAAHKIERRRTAQLRELLKCADDEADTRARTDKTRRKIRESLNGETQTE
jgi:uncharacterized protein (DUF3084 family)